MCTTNTGKLDCVIRATAWMQLEDMMLSERKPDTVGVSHVSCDSVCVKCPEYTNPQGEKVDSWLPGARGGDHGM